MTVEVIVISDWGAGIATMLRRKVDAITGIVVHRIEVSQEDSTYGDSPEEVARFFSEHPVGRRATGGGMPYPIVIDAAGVVTQMVPLSCVTPHARVHNPATIGIALVGDFREHPPQPPQYVGLVQVCTHLLTTFSLSSEALWAHDELPDGSSAAHKECPGCYLSIEALKENVARSMAVETSLRGEFVWDER